MQENIINNTTTNTNETVKSDKFSIPISRDPRLLLTLLCVCEKNIVRYFVLAVSFIPIIGQFSSYIIPLAYIILFIYYINRYGVRISLKEMMVPLLVVLAIVGTIIVYPDNARFILDDNNLWGTIVPCLRFYLVALIISTDERTINIICKASCAGVLVEALFLIAYMMPRGIVLAEDMNRAYQLLPNVLIVLYYAWKVKKPVPIITAIIGVLYTIAMGSRGPVVIILAYIGLRIIKTSAKRIVKVITMIVLAVIAVFGFSSSLFMKFNQWMLDIFQSIGLPTRVIEMALSGQSLTYMSDRDSIFNVVLEKIQERPFLGYGVYGEWNWVGWNAHNMYLELLAHFGVILGGGIIIWMIYTVFKAYFKFANDYGKELLLIWICCVFVRGFFSGSYLTYTCAFLIGLCFNIRKNTDKHDKKVTYFRFKKARGD